MKRKDLRSFVRCLFMILLAMCGFLVGFCVNESINRNAEERKTRQSQIWIIPNMSEKRGNVICEEADRRVFI